MATATEIDIDTASQEHSVGFTDPEDLPLVLMLRPGPQERVLMRVDFNVPVHEGKILDTQRIGAIAASLLYLVPDCSVILLAHYGQPQGYDANADLSFVLPTLRELFPDFTFTSCSLDQLADKVKTQKKKEVIVLDNLRFYPGETADCPQERAAFAARLAAHADYYVNDAFSVCHRHHASVCELPRLLPAFAGLTLHSEIYEINNLLQAPKRPRLAIVGGAKLLSKLDFLLALVKDCDRIFVGGRVGVVLTRFIKGFEITAEEWEAADRLFKTADAVGCNVLLPGDFAVVPKDKRREPIMKPHDKLVETDVCQDIGPMTCLSLEAMMHQAQSVLWNGPMGRLEDRKYAAGTKAVIRMLETLHNTPILVGGGETLALFRQNMAAAPAARAGEWNIYLSLGGGAFLAYCAYGRLPGVDALLEASR